MNRWSCGEKYETAISPIHKIGAIGGFATSKPPKTREQVCDRCSRIPFSVLTSGFNDKGRQPLVQRWYRSVLKKIVRTFIFALFVSVVFPCLKSAHRPSSTPLSCQGYKTFTYLLEVIRARWSSKPIGLLGQSQRQSFPLYLWLRNERLTSLLLSDVNGC